MYPGQEEDEQTPDGAFLAQQIERAIDILDVALGQDKPIQLEVIYDPTGLIDRCMRVMRKVDNLEHFSGGPKEKDQQPPEG